MNQAEWATEQTLTGESLAERPPGVPERHPDGPVLHAGRRRERGRLARRAGRGVRHRAVDLRQRRDGPPLRTLGERSTMRQPMIVDRPALIVVDIQKGGGLPLEEVGIPVMAGYEEQIQRAIAMVGAARDAGIPVIFFQEVHRRSLVDFGRELDGVETVHGLDGDEATELDDRAAAAGGRRPHREASLLVLLRHRARDPAEGARRDDAGAHRRAHRRLRALHVRRRPPARLLRARRRGLRARVVAVRARRVARTPWSTCRPARGARPPRCSRRSPSSARREITPVEVTA